MTHNEQRALRKLAAQHGLTEWHWTAACILGSLHGYEYAAQYLADVAQREERAA